MGYTTDFNGAFTVEPALTPEHRDYLVAFNQTRRMARDPEKAALLPDPIRVAAGLALGEPDAAYFVGGQRFGSTLDDDPSVLDYNEPPGAPIKDLVIRGTTIRCEVDGPHAVIGNHHTNAPGHNCEWGMAREGTPDAQPGLWCQWVPSNDGTVLEWDEGEKFYDYVKWLDYLLRHFLGPWGYRLGGTVYWSGEDPDDRGRITVDEDQSIRVGEGHIVYDD